MKAKNVSEPTVSLQEGRDPTAALAKLYRAGRSFPVRQPVRVEPSRRAAENGSKDREQRPQFRDDQGGPGYSNDVSSSWLRGMGKGEAEGKPNFDKGPSGSRHDTKGR